MRPEVLAQHTAAAIRGAVTPLAAQMADLRGRLGGLEADLARERAAVADLRQTVAALQDSNKALGRLVTRSLDVPSHTPCLDDLSPDSAKH